MYQALVKAEGQTFADRVLAHAAKGSDTFLNKKTPLNSATTRLIAQQSHALHVAYRHKTDAIVDNFLNRDFPSAIGEKFKTLNYGGYLKKSDMYKLEQEFLIQVRTSHIYGREVMSPDELKNIANTVTENYCKSKQARFAEQHPGLSALTHHRHLDAMACVQQCKAEFEKAEKGDFGYLSTNQKEATLNVLTQLITADEALGKMSFNVLEAANLSKQLSKNVAELHAAQADLEEAFGGVEDGVQTSLHRDLSEQIRKLNDKIAFLHDYVNQDPLSEKSVAQNQLIWSQSSQLALQRIHGSLTTQLSSCKKSGEIENLKQAILALNRFIKEAEQRVVGATQELDNAKLQRTVTPRPPGRFGPTHPFKQQQKSEEAFLKRALKCAKIVTPDRITDRIERERCNVLDTVTEWKPVERRMVVSRDGLTRTYVSKITPGSQIGHEVGERYAAQGLKGISAGNQTDPHHARNLMISELYRMDYDPKTDTEKAVKISQTIRHGVLDPWKIKDPKLRKQASQEGAHEVLNAAIVANEPFMERAIKNSNLGAPSKVVHINLNLTTADDTWARQLAPDFREGEFTRNQFEAFEANNGPCAFLIDNQAVKVDVDTITFSFGVNGLALGEGLGRVVSEKSLWPPAIVEHNRQNLRKLVGSLEEGAYPGGYIGGLADRLIERAKDWETPKSEVHKIEALLTQLQDEVDTVRKMFNNDEYKHGMDDAYKMNRHLMRVTNLGAEALQLLGDDSMMMSLSQGCKSNKDRGGMADVEHKAQMMIEDMGGHVRPGQPFDEQDGAIYKTALTASGQVEIQSLNTGLPGSKNAGEVKARIADKDAVEYASGYSEFAKA